MGPTRGWVLVDGREDGDGGLKQLEKLRDGTGGAMG